MFILSPAAPHDKTVVSDMAMDEIALKNKRLCRNIQKYVENSSEDSDNDAYTESLIPTDEELFSKYIVPYRRPLTEDDRMVEALNVRAVKALQESDKELFTNAILETDSLYARDDAVRVAAEVGWIDVARRLLVKKTDASYQYPAWMAPLTSTFAKLNNGCNLRTPKGRWLLQMAVLSAVKKNRKEIFNLLAPIAGIDFADIRGRDVVDHVSSSEVDLDTKKEWLSLIVKHIDRNTSRPLLGNAIQQCALVQSIEHLPYLLGCLFSSGEGLAWARATLTTAIKQRHPEVAHCVVDEFKKASIPIPMSAMYSAVIVEDIDMVLYLHRKGCHSFPLKSYGERFAGDLRKLLSKHNHEDIYPSIIVEASSQAA